MQWWFIFLPYSVPTCTSHRSSDHTDCLETCYYIQRTDQKLELWPEITFNKTFMHSFTFFALTRSSRVRTSIWSRSTGVLKFVIFSLFTDIQMEHSTSNDAVQYPASEREILYFQGASVNSCLPMCLFWKQEFTVRNLYCPVYFSSQSQTNCIFTCMRTS